MMESLNEKASRESFVERGDPAQRNDRVSVKESANQAPDTDRKLVEKITDTHKATPAERAYANLGTQKVPADPSVCTFHNPTGGPVKQQPVIERWDGIVRSDPSQREADKAVAILAAPVVAAVVVAAEEAVNLLPKPGILFYKWLDKTGDYYDQINRAK